MRFLHYFLLIPLILLNSTSFCMKRTLEDAAPREFSWNGLPLQIKQRMMALYPIKNVMRLVCKQCYEWLKWENKDTLLLKFPDMKFTRYTWNSIMPILCANNKVELVKAICATQPKTKKWINKQDFFNNVLLSYAHTAEMRETLFTAGADRENITESVLSPLNKAIFLDDVKAVQLYLKNNPKIDQFAVPPIFFACIFKRFNIAQQLIDHGVDTCAILDNKNTLLHQVASNSTDLFMRLLLKSKAMRLINHPNYEGKTPLMLAINNLEPNSDMVRLLIDSGADINMLDTDFKGTSLWIAVYLRKPIEIIKVLLQAKPNDIDYIPETREKCALSIAVNDQNYELAALLIKHGAHINAPEKYNMTPLRRAIGGPRKKPSLSMVKHLLECGKSEIHDNPLLISNTVTHTKAIINDPDFVILSSQEKNDLKAILNLLTTA